MRVAVEEDDKNILRSGTEAKCAANFNFFLASRRRSSREIPYDRLPFPGNSIAFPFCKLIVNNFAVIYRYRQGQSRATRGSSILFCLWSV